MPNWCANTLIIDGFSDLSDAVQKVVQAGEDGERVRLFQAFVPMPEEVRSVEEGGGSRRWREIDGKNVSVDESELAELRRKYGAAIWYDWAIPNWGTKWDTAKVHGEPGQVWFDTAWGPPEAFVRTLSELYPRAVLTLAYAEGGMGFRGTFTYVAGAKRDESGSEDFWDEDGMTTEECTAFLETYALHTGG